MHRGFSLSSCTEVGLVPNTMLLTQLSAMPSPLHRRTKTSPPACVNRGIP